MSVIERQNKVESKICFRVFRSGLHLPELPKSGLPDYSLMSYSFHLEYEPVPKVYQNNPEKGGF